MLVATALLTLGEALLRWHLLPSPAPGPGLLAQRYQDARLGGQPGPAYLETRVAMSDTRDADFRAENFSLRLTGSLNLTIPGPYLLGVESDDDSRLFIDGFLVVDNSGAHPLRLRSAWLMLGPGRHLIEVEYAQRDKQAALRLAWRPFYRLALSDLPLKRLEPSAAPLGRAQAQALGESLRTGLTPCLALVLWLGLALSAGRWLPLPRRPWLWGAASLAMCLGMWLCSGTMSIYGAGSPGGHLSGPCGYVINVDHQHFEATYWLLDGDPPAKWGFSLVLRRILYPLLAYPFMLARGFMEGGFLANIFLHLLALYSWGLYLERQVGRRGAFWGVWLLALYPGISYWAGLPYSYAIIVPACLWGFMLLRVLDQAAGPRPVLLACLGLGVLALGYDLLPFFAPAGLGLVWWRSRRLTWTGLGLAALAAPTLVSLLVLAALGVPAQSQNAAQPLAILMSYLHVSDWAAWGRLLAGVPEVLVNNFLASNFYVLPLLFLALLLPNLRRGGLRLQAPETALLLALLAVFLFNNLAPPHSFKTFRGVHVARFYQPAFTVMIFYVARVMQADPPGPAWWPRLAAGLCCLALLANAAIILGPVAGLPQASEIYWRFYRHANDSQTLTRFLDRHGRHPLGTGCPR
jgi:hypothetical protein